MNPNSHRELIDDVLVDAELAAFKEDLLGQCLGQLKRRRCRRTILHVFAAAAAIILLVLILPRDTAPPMPVDGVGTSDYIVNTVPLSDQQIARGVASCETVRTQTNAYVVQKTTTAPSLKVQGRHEVAQMDDAEMLELFAGTSCGIIRPQGGQSRLVFFDAEDAQRFFGRP